MMSWSLLLAIACLHQSDGADASLTALRERADTLRLSTLVPQPLPAEMVSTPIFRYSDELRKIEDAGIWIWTRGGRPEGVMKVERYPVGLHPSPWLFCFSSVSTNLVVAQWEDERTFKATKPGVQWKTLADKPLGNRTARLIQMRDLARRFSAELIGTPDGGNRRQMRLLSKPLFRYPEKLTEGGDGAVFGFTGTGTNPDFLLLLDETPGTGWRYGLATMTAEGLVVKLNDELVWEAAHTAGRGTVFDTWTMFFGRREMKLAR
jgi:hypothetical protein